MLKELSLRFSELRQERESLRKALAGYPANVLETSRKMQYLVDIVDAFALDNRLLIYLENPEIQNDNGPAVRDFLQKLFDVFEKRIAELRDAPQCVNDGFFELADVIMQNECLRAIERIR